MARVTILGAGSWGTALATLLAHNGHDVLLWCYEEDIVCQINEQHTNRYLPDVVLDKSIRATHDLGVAFAHSMTVFEAIPVCYLRSVLTQALSFITNNHRWIITSKGIEQKTLMLVSEILEDLGVSQEHSVVLSGPSFASDVAKKMPTCVVLASWNRQLASDIQKLVSASYFITEYSTDAIGVQVCGALKNVITIAIGFVRGAGYADNTAACVFMKGLDDCVRVIKQKGGEKESLYGPAGIGDVVLTAWGKSSRNFKFGALLGQGLTSSEIERKLTLLPEGYYTTKSLYHCAKLKNLSIPLCNAVYNVIYNNATITTFLDCLLKS